MSGAARMARRLRRLPVVTSGGFARNAPKTRAECEPNGTGERASRPCRFVACKWHLLLDVSASGSIRFNHGPIDADGDHVEETLASMRHTCALDVIDEMDPEKGVTLDEVAEHMGYDSRQAAKAILDRAEEKLFVSSWELRKLL